MAALEITRRTSLEPDELAAVRRLVDAVAAADGVAPLNEAAVLALTHEGAHYVATAGTDVVGYAQHQPEVGTAQLAVRPEARRSGIGTALVRATSADAPEALYWAFGNLAGARELALRLGATNARELLIMERPLTLDEPQAPLAPGVTLRAFVPADEHALLAVNAAAFARHPEQGAMDHADFAERTAQAWYDPADLLVAVDATGALLGFHWTKRHDARTGEVYVIATAPDASGQGLGTALLTAGLAHLATRGCREVILYVEADNPAARLYRRHGFTVGRSDVCYAPPGRQSR